MHELVRASEKVEKEIGRIADKQDLSMADIEALCKAVGLIEKIEKTLAIRDGMVEGEDDMMYGRSYGRTYMPNGRRYGTSYSNNGMYYRDAGPNNYRGIDYSHGSEKEIMVDKLETMMTSSGNEKYRQAIAEAIERINRLGN